jgi:hypothetical protein
MLAAFVPGVTASGGSVKLFSASLVSPVSAIAGAPTTFTFRFTSSASTSTGNPLGSLQLALPSGFSGLTPGTATAPGGTWEEIASSNVLQVDTHNLGGSGKLNPGQSVTFTFTATAPLQPGVYAFTAAAKTSADFTGPFFNLGGAQPTVTVLAPPATTLSIINLPAGGATAGQPFSFTVKAASAFGTTATGYTGTVHFTTSDQGSGVAVPADYAFAPADQGVHTFTSGATLTTAGSQSLTATDTSNSSITGTAAVAVHAGAATKLVLSAPGGAIAGSSIAATVTLYDAYGNVATGYTGTVGFSSSDHGANTQLPAAYTFTSGDAGTHAFTVVLTTAGAQSVTATDTVTANLTSTAGVAVSPAAATALQVSGLPGSPVGAGTAFSATVTAVDPYGNVATGYAGTVHFTSSDGNASAVLPANYTFNAADAGVHVFTGGFALVSLGAQSITATDVATPSITGSGGVTVKPGPAAQLVIVSVTDEGTGLPAPVKGGPFDVAVLTEDAYGNVSPVSQPTTVALTLQTGTGTLSGNLTVVVASGQSTGTVTGAQYSVGENGVVLVASSIAGDSLQPAQVKVNVQSVAASIVGTPGISTTLFSTACTDATPAVPTCATTYFQHGINGKAYFSEGVCSGVATGCLTGGGETALLANVTANMKDANGNPLYTRSDPALTVVECDKSLCSHAGVNKFVLFVDVNGTGQYVQAPACPSAGTIAPTGVPFCVDYFSSHRDGSGDTLLYFYFAIDFIVHYG